ncbi:protein lin-28 homolog B-like [Leptopilina heterotoma]|uniref:protein lin-28 homolog B-like n=1 Tax=Leptopilina heterotoma TaxID=63436 RepID=UPI001CA8FA41|nr:protein lin-28 homolog B-like [Leptopilina heterotoma]
MGTNQTPPQQQNQPTLRNGQNIGANPKGFVGACFHCQGVGHKASECRFRVCHFCKEQGHYANQCPLKQKCQVCGTPGVVFANCPNCIQLRQYQIALGNERAGGQNCPAPPPLHRGNQHGHHDQRKSGEICECTCTSV